MKQYNLIFGCGYYGRAIYRKIKKKNIIFIDNDLKIKSCLNKKVLNPNKFKGKQNLIKNIYLAGRYLDYQIPQLKKINLYKRVKIFKNYELIPKKKVLLSREKKILRILKLLFGEFNKVKINYWIDRSSLLAIFRNQHLSEFSDVDISIDIKDYKKLSLVLKKFKKKINILFKKILYNRKIIKKFYIINSSVDIKKEEPVLIDFIYRKIKKKKIDSIGIDLKSVPARILKKKILYNYKNIQFYIPYYSKKYLNFIYGSNWKKKAKFYLKSGRI